MKPKNVTDSNFIEYNEEFNKKDPKFKVGDQVRISRYKNFFLKVTHLIGGKKFLLPIKYKIQSLGLI